MKKTASRRSPEGDRRRGLAHIESIVSVRKRLRELRHERDLIEKTIAALMKVSRSRQRRNARKVD
jgi:hypothetical protein